MDVPLCIHNAASMKPIKGTVHFIVARERTGEIILEGHYLCPGKIIYWRNWKLIQAFFLDIANTYLSTPPRDLNHCFTTEKEIFVLYFPRDPQYN